VATDTASAIESRGLVKSYGGAVRALDGLDLRVERGEVFGFLGPNGAGKTTAIRILLDLLRPDAGYAAVLGLDPQRDSLAMRARVGYLPGDLSLYPGMNARSLMALRSSLGKGAMDQAYTRSLCERLGVALDTPVRELSHGNKQKVGIVLALMTRPDLVILDEPTSGLDPLVQHQVLELLREVRSDGRTVFFSSHVLSEVERICDRVGIIRAGRLVATESVEAVRARQVHRVEITFANPVPPGLFATLPSVSEERSAGATVRCMVEGDLDPVVKAAAVHHVVSMEVSQPSLEEVFMALYRHQEGERT
jgi:ABC-2 type transport system ATP-binding protein